MLSISSEYNTNYDSSWWCEQCDREYVECSCNNCSHCSEDFSLCLCYNDKNF